MSDLPEEAARSHKSRLKSGTILVAREALVDPNFNNTIVLLCQYSEAGAYGLVLNHAAHMPLHEIFEHPPELSGGASGNRRVYIGGPVQSTELQILQIGTDPAPESLEIAPGIHLGGAWEQVEDFLQRDPRDLRLFLGYSGWGEGQLEEEVEAGAWEVHETDIRRLLEAPEALWTGGREQLRRFLGA
ncbi:MAG: protein yqgE [Fibrobacteria bacterium]|jgi:putative transcriptional regulator|nr:protein yqgE [Fibrobacteria bacterium]